MATTTSPTILTEAFVKDLETKEKPYLIRDRAVPGFMVAINLRSKSYKIQRDLWTGEHGQKRFVRTIRRTIGSVDELSLKKARQEAMLIIAEIAEGIDPNEVATVGAAEMWTVKEMYYEYIADLRARECSEVTVKGMLFRLNRHLKKWKNLPISDIKRSMCRKEHKRITAAYGKYAGNHTLRDFRACYNLALRVMDDPDGLPDNPVKAVTFNKERAANRFIMPDDLPDWWQRVAALRNPLRRTMHELGLFSGLRPGTLVSLKRDWVQMKERAINIPKMKTGRSFSLPLSEHMAQLVQNALEIGDTLFPGSEWLFPSRSSKTGKVIACQVWKEYSLPSETGHILRHTYRTVAQRLKIDPIDRRLLLDHKVPGIDGVYVHEKALFDKLLEAQQLVSKELLDLMGRTETTEP